MNAPVSFRVATILAPNRFVSCSITNPQHVEYPATSSRMILGVTAQDVKGTNQGIPVVTAENIAKVEFNGAVATGQLVASDSQGRGVAFALAETTTSLSLPSAYGGILIGPTVAVTGTLADVFVRPGLVK